jgi:hypothetical protein
MRIVPRTRRIAIASASLAALTVVALAACTGESPMSAAPDDPMITALPITDADVSGSSIVW